MATARKVNGSQRSASSPIAAEGLAAQLHGLERLDLGQLRVQYRNRTGRIAPTRISRPLLLRVLAHEVQVEAFGDLSRETRRMLDRLGADAQKVRLAQANGMDIAGANPAEDQEEGAAAPARAEAPAPFSVKPGTLLSREWQGRMETVMALEEGYAWNGKAHASLSAVAFAITGTKWNGHRFFGLRDRQKSEAFVDERIGSVSKPDRDRGARTSSLRPSLAERPGRSGSGARP